MGHNPWTGDNPAGPYCTSPTDNGQNRVNWLHWLFFSLYRLRDCKNLVQRRGLSSRTSKLLWYLNPINFIFEKVDAITSKVLYQSLNIIQKKSRFPAIHCPHCQEKLRTFIIIPWRDTKKRRFHGPIRTMNLGIIFNLWPSRPLPKPSRRDVTPSPSQTCRPPLLSLGLILPVCPGFFPHLRSTGSWDLLY